MLALSLYRVMKKIPLTKAAIDRNLVCLEVLQTKAPEEIIQTEDNDIVNK